MSVRTICDKNGLETNKLLAIRLGWDMIVIMNRPVDSASPVNLIKQNVLLELKIRHPYLKPIV